MISLKKQKGFTLVELLIVIIIIGILATLVIITFTGVQAKARDSKRQTDITAIDATVSAFFAQYGFYPTQADLSQTGNGNFNSTFLKGFDPAALVDPKGNPAGTNPCTVDSATCYGYVAAGTGCSNTTLTTITNGVPQSNSCTSFTATADLEAGGKFVKASNT